jgi:hypothetical protein
MAEVIQAFARVALGGVVLLDFDDQMESHYDFAQARFVESKPLVRASATRQFARGNKSHRLTVSRVKFFTDADQTTFFGINHARELPEGAADLVITWANGASVTFANTILDANAYHGRPVNGVEFHAEYNLLCGGITAVTQPQ